MRQSARRHDGGTSQKPAVPFQVTLGRMLKTLWRPELKRWRFRIVSAFALTILAKGFAVTAPLYLGQAINHLTVEDVATRSFITFVGLVMVFGVLRLSSNVLPQIRDAFFVRVTQNISRVVASEAFLHAQRQSLHFHLSRRTGALNRIIERGSGAMEFLLRFLVFNIGPTLLELIMAAGVITVLYGWQLALVVVVTVVLYVVFTVVLTRWRNRLRRAMNEADTELKAISVDTFTNFETVKAFAAEEREAERFDSAIQSYIHRYVRSLQSMHVMNGGQQFLMTAGLVVAAIVAGYGVLVERMAIGDITAVFLMMTNIYRPLNILGFAWREINQSSVDVENLYEMLGTVPEINDLPGAPDLSVQEGAISFNNVHFAYQGRDNSLNGVSFEVSAGKFVGVVGPSGAGKSTLIKLLFRFYDPLSGQVFIDGQNVQSVSQSSLRTALGLVPQDVSLFNDTLRMNVSYGHPDASDEDIAMALARAQLNDFVDQLPDGLHTIVGERGLKLSGGERQRVGLARAILRNPSILILDEATSSLDSETEKDVQKALREAARGRTTIAIAHRLSTIIDADQILVMNAGQIVERGTHQELLNQDGLYARLWRQQVRSTLVEPDGAQGGEPAIDLGDYATSATPT